MGQLNFFWHTFEETGSIHSYMSYSKWRELTEGRDPRWQALEQPRAARRSEEEELTHDHSM